LIYVKTYHSVIRHTDLSEKGNQMLTTPREEDLYDLFEEVWQLADMVAETPDRHFAPILLGLAYDILDWINAAELERDA
jgi:hypothetical protein